MSQGRPPPPRRAPASSSNKAKQVAPLPDMRTKLAPCCCPSQSSTSPIAGTSARAGASRSLRPSRQSSSGPRSTPSHAANTAPVDSGTPGLTSKTGVPAMVGSSISVERVPRPVPARRHAQQAGGDVGAQRRRDRRRMRRVEPPHPRQQPERRRGIGRPAADPRRDGQSLVERQRSAPPSSIGPRRSRSASAARMTRLSSSGPRPRAIGPRPSATDHLVDARREACRRRCRRRTPSRAGGARRASVRGRGARG